MTRCSFTIAVFTLMTNVVASAQEVSSVPETIDLSALLRIVREVSPRIALERQSIAGAEANRITAGAYPNPTLNYGYGRQGGGQPTVITGRRQDQASVDFPLLIAGQREARVE